MKASVNKDSEPAELSPGTHIIPADKYTKREQIDIAVKDVSDAMYENVLANKAVTDAHARKTKAHYTLQRAKERLYELERELMQ